MTTKEKILHSALEIFIERGIDNTPTSAITKNAGFSEATLFIHFGSKQGLVDALYLFLKEKQKIIFSESEIDPKDAEKSLVNLFAYCVKYFIENYNEALFLRHVHSSHHISKEVHDIVARDSKKLIDSFNAWKKSSQIKDIDINFYVDIFWSLMFATVNYCRDNNKKRVPKKLESLLWDSLKNN